GFLLEGGRRLEAIEDAIVLALRRRRRCARVRARIRRRRRVVARVGPSRVFAAVVASAASAVAAVAAVAAAAVVARVGRAAVRARVFLVLDATELDRAVPRRVAPDLIAAVDHPRRERQRLVVRGDRLLVLAAEKMQIALEVARARAEIDGLRVVVRDRLD